MLEPDGEAVIVVEKVVDFGEDPPPLLLRVGQGAEDWLEPSSVKHTLVIQILKGECQLFALRDTFN